MKVAAALMRLYIIHISAFLTVTLSTFFPGWDLVLSGIYLLVIALEGRIQSDMSGKEKILTALVWQGPAIFLAVYVLKGWTFGSLCDYAIFILQFWSAPLLPWWSLANINVSGQYPAYYYLILTTPFLLALWYLIPAWTDNKKSAGLSE